MQIEIIKSKAKKRRNNSNEKSILNVTSWELEMIQINILNLSQTDFAKKIGVTQSFISHLKQGKRRLSKKQIATLDQVLLPFGLIEVLQKIRVIEKMKEEILTR